MEGVLIVGASLAGGRVAELLRRQGYEGRVTLVGAEPQRPYDRPPLSKKFLRGLHPEEQLYFRPEAWYAEQRVDVLFGVRATRLDTDARSVELEDGRKLGFETLVIATGADARRLSCPGAELANVHVLRSLADALAIRKEGFRGRRAVVVGAGVIGMEVAAALREEGADVTVLEAAPAPLTRALGSVIGGIYADVHRGHGVDLRCGVSIAEIRRDEVETTTGERIACDFVVAGIGVTPATAWLAGSPVRCEDGVIVDARCETNVPGIFAAGDVARFHSELAGATVRLESVDSAQAQAAMIVAAILGREILPAPVPYFWSDQYDLKLQSVGFVGAFDRVVFRGSVPDRKFVAFHVAADRLRFAVGVNRLKEIGAAKKLIGARVAITDAQLADESFALASLLG